MHNGLKTERRDVQAAVEIVKTRHKHLDLLLNVAGVLHRSGEFAPGVYLRFLYATLCLRPLILHLRLCNVSNTFDLVCSLLNLCTTYLSLLWCHCTK